MAGLCAARVAAGMGADVTVFDVDVARMRYIDEVWGGAYWYAVFESVGGSGGVW